jgi:hypothetical protein
MESAYLNTTLQKHILDVPLAHILTNSVRNFQKGVVKASAVWHHTPSISGVSKRYVFAQLNDGEAVVLRGTGFEPADPYGTAS